MTIQLPDNPIPFPEDYEPDVGDAHRCAQNAENALSSVESCVDLRDVILNLIEAQDELDAAIADVKEALIAAHAAARTAARTQKKRTK